MRLFFGCCVLFLFVGCRHIPAEWNPRQFSSPYFDPQPDAVLSFVPVNETDSADQNHISDFVDYYVELALERNPEIRARARRAQALAERFPQATALPDPILSNTIWPISSNAPQTAMGRSTHSLTLMQRYPWFGKLRLRGEVARADARIALTELAAAQLKVIEDVKLAYYEIYFNQRAIDITRHDEALLRDIVKFAEARYKVGQASQQDVLRAQVELTKIREQLIRFERALRVAQADLATLLSLPAESDLRAAGLPDSVSIPDELDALYEVALATRPELQGRLEAIFRDQRLVELSRLESRPDVDLGITWAASTRAAALAPSANGNDMIGLNLNLNLPIWKRKLDAAVREAQNRAAESRELYDSTRNETFRFIRRLIVQAHAIEQQVALFRDEIIPKAEQTLKTSTADYRVGKVDMLTLLDNWSQLLRFEIQLVRLQANLFQVLASLERVLGTELSATTPAPTR
ncbi:MAG: RND transporter [Gemmatales bacterium]|nr:MAG: RND transporter [Gemmatales bacterium]